MPNHAEKRVAQELGLICIYWGWIETAINDLIEQLAPLETGHPSQAITGNVDIRPKLQILKALSFIRRPSDTWFELMTKTIDHIDNNLRPRRNQYVHSGWFRPNRELVNRVRKTKITKPQAFRLELVTEADVPTKIGDIRRLRSELLKCLKQLVALDASFMTAKSGDSATFHAIRAQRFPRRPRRGSRRTNASSVRTRQRQSS